MVKNIQRRIIFGFNCAIKIKNCSFFLFAALILNKEKECLKMDVRNIRSLNIVSSLFTIFFFEFFWKIEYRWETIFHTSSSNTSINPLSKSMIRLHLAWRTTLFKLYLPTSLHGKALHSRTDIFNGNSKFFLLPLFSLSTIIKTLHFYFLHMEISSCKRYIIWIKIKNRIENNSYFVSNFL